jgi:hypothetical protein
MLKENGLVVSIIEDLSRYHQAAKAQLQAQGALPSTEDRLKIKVQGSLYNHHVEVGERLGFI